MAADAGPEPGRQPGLAGAQREEDLAHHVASAMRRSLTDPNPPRLVFEHAETAKPGWLRCRRDWQAYPG